MNVTMGQTMLVTWKSMLREFTFKFMTTNVSSANLKQHERAL